MESGLLGEDICRMSKAANNAWLSGSVASGKMEQDING
jgi:hypothetical protein